MIRKFFPMFILFVVAAGVNRPAMAMECAPGYRIYSDGSCQAVNMIIDSRCPPSFTAQVFPNAAGYMCIPETWPGGGKYRG